MDVFRLAGEWTSGKVSLSLPMCDNLCYIIDEIVIPLLRKDSYLNTLVGIVTLTVLLIV